MRLFKVCFCYHKNCGETAILIKYTGKNTTELFFVSDIVGLPYKTLSKTAK